MVERTNWKDGKKHGLSESWHVFSHEFSRAEYWVNGKRIEFSFERITSCTDAD